jgi:hypothetical protein
MMKQFLLNYFITLTDFNPFPLQSTVIQLLRKYYFKTFW